MQGVPEVVHIPEEPQELALLVAVMDQLAQRQQPRERLTLVVVVAEPEVVQVLEAPLEQAAQESSSFATQQRQHHQQQRQEVRKSLMLAVIKFILGPHPVRLRFKE